MSDHTQGGPYGNRLDDAIHHVIAHALPYGGLSTSLLVPAEYYIELREAFSERNKHERERGAFRDYWIGVRYDLSMPGVPVVGESITFTNEEQIRDYAEGQGLWIVWPHNGEGHPEDDMSKEVLVERYDYLPTAWFPKDADAYWAEAGGTT
jgi:hypothetical protein